MSFFMYNEDGLQCRARPYLEEESPKYSEQGFSTAGDDITGRTEVGTYNMWVNREPRFYQTVFYHGRKWHLTNRVVKFNRGNGNVYLQVVGVK